MNDIPIGEDGLPFLSAETLGTAPLSLLDDARRHTPVLRTDARRVTVMRCADVARLATAPNLVQVPGAQYAEVMHIPEGRGRAFLTAFMLMSNGADHARRRGAFAKTFAHPAIRARRGQVRAVADEIVADLPKGEAFDFLDLCSSRLPSEVIAAILGLPREQSRWFARQVYLVSRLLMPPYDIAHHDRIEAAAEALFTFVRETLADRREAPRDDLLSALANDESARALDVDELVYQVMGVILGGSDTTRSAFTLTVGHLLEDRSRWDEVRENRDLIPAAIDESLRIDPPIGTMPRFNPGPLEIGGLTVPPGNMVALSTLSALRDEVAVAEPGRFDLHRTDHVRPHLVFGGGAHRCLGEMLARIELEEGLAALLDAAPGIEMIEAPRMLGYGGIRRATALVARIPG